MEMDEKQITYFAQTDARGKRTPFGIRAKDRSRHVYVIGKTGMGKSTLLENMAIQDIRNGESLAFLDPHGKSAELLLDHVPADRINDVLYVAPFDTDYPISFNVMEDVGPDKRHLVVSGLMSTFEKIWVDAWSARMAYILSNTLLALLEYPDSTLLGINRMLSDKEYRRLIVAHIKDPAVRSFWVDEFAKYTDRYTQEATPAIQNKVGQFTANPLIRNIVGQPKSSFDFRQMIDERKIIIVNLSKGLVGEGNANLLGSMLITKLYLAALSRANVSQATLHSLPPLYLYVDEFQSFANKSFADILSESRKYKLALTIAHQYIEQMEEEVRAAVFGNVGTMICFRVGAYDAEVLEREFSPQFTAEDLVNLGIFQIYLKLMIDGVTSPPFSAITLEPSSKPTVSFKKDIIEASRRQFGRPRSAVEAAILKWHEPVIPPERERGKDVRHQVPPPAAPRPMETPREKGGRPPGHSTDGGERPHGGGPERSGAGARFEPRFPQDPRRHGAASVPAPSRPLSLRELKEGVSFHKEKRHAEEGTRDELRKVLSEVLGKEGEKKVDAGDAGRVARETPASPEGSPRPGNTPKEGAAPRAEETPQRGEVPEELLRKTLKTDDET